MSNAFSAKGSISFISRIGICPLRLSEMPSGLWDFMGEDDEMPSASKYART
jgi:hypothetical protein